VLPSLPQKAALLDALRARDRLRLLGKVPSAPGPEPCRCPILPFSARQPLKQRSAHACAVLAYPKSHACAVLAFAKCHMHALSWHLQKNVMHGNMHAGEAP
jgi:hypothetical protein